MRHFPTAAAGMLALALSACGDAPLQPEPSPTRSVTASSTLTITSLYCEDVGGGGTYYNETYCEAYASGGTGGTTWDWDVIVTSQFEADDYSYITGVCTDSYPVTVTARDSSGATASMSGTFRCYASSSGGGGEVP